MKNILCAVLAVLTLSCSSIQLRVSGASVLGGALGGMGGYAFSPYEQDRIPNLILFGMAGALIGGACGLLWPDDFEQEKNATLKRSESDYSKQIILSNPSELPDFLKNRIQPTIIEEFTEKPTLSEDGSIHEPHKVYKIKRPIELSPEPNLQSLNTVSGYPNE